VATNGLETQGAKDGHPHVIAMVIAKCAGAEYLMSVRGECEWSAERASARCSLDHQQ
jgi:hypothetical protein